MSQRISSAVCSITPTQRRRFFWAAWWTGTPKYAPFRKPDAANGGARTYEEALMEAQAVAGRALSIVDPYWARAWKTVLRGEMPAPPADPEAEKRRPAPAPRKQPASVSAWSILGLAPGATFAEVKRAYQRRALETHPDQGGDADRFREVQRAYERLLERLRSKRA